jgi:hypothetical protein
MALIGLGWLGWTEEQVLWSDMNVFAIAYRGRNDMLQAIFGKPKPVLVPPQRTGGAKIIPITPDIFDKTFGKPEGTI